MRVPKKKMKYEHPTMVPLKERKSALGVCKPTGTIANPDVDDCTTGYDPPNGVCNNGTKAA